MRDINGLKIVTISMGFFEVNLSKCYQPAFTQFESTYRSGENNNQKDAV